VLAYAFVVLIVLVGASVGSVTAHLHRSGALKRTAVIAWLACVVLLPLSAKAAPDACESGASVIVTAYVVAIVGALTIAACCGFFSRILLGSWLWSVVAAVPAAGASYLLVTLIFIWLPTPQNHCPEITL
jgi:hypothetical protein